MLAAPGKKINSRPLDRGPFLNRPLSGSHVDLPEQDTADDEEDHQKEDAPPWILPRAPEQSEQDRPQDPCKLGHRAEESEELPGLPPGNHRGEE